MCLDLLSEEAVCGSILVNDRLPVATTQSLHFARVVAYGRFDYTFIAFTL